MLIIALASGTSQTSFQDIITLLQGSYDGLNTYTFRGLLTLAGTAILLPAFLISAKIVGDRPLSSYFYSREKWNWKLFIYSMIITVLVLIIPSVYLIYAHGLTFNNHFTILTLLLTLILAPLQTWGEEVIFRGLIMQTLGSWLKIPVLAIVIQAILFTMIHPYNIIGIVDILVYGLLYGIVTWKTNVWKHQWLCMQPTTPSYLYC